MFKDQPKGLYVAFFTNMGERFGFYTMLAIFMLFLQAKYGLDATAASRVYGIFMAGVYFLPLIGGIVADRFLGYGKTISIGIVVMFVGYLMLAFPTAMGQGFFLVIAALAVICLGTGFFKGNLQALVGNLYDDPRYSAKRDQAFNIFYMGINIGAMFAPTAAQAISNWILHSQNFFYDARIPAMANAFIKGKLVNVQEYLAIASKQDAGVSLDTLSSFSEKYITTLSKSYHFGFGLACISLIMSMIVFWIFRRHYAHASMTEKQKRGSPVSTAAIAPLSSQQIRERMVALGLVYFVVIFFWMSFHQNGVTMTWFARDYTLLQANRITNVMFDLFGLLLLFFAVLGLVYLFKKGIKRSRKLAGAAMFVLFSLIAAWRIGNYAHTNRVTPQMFQQFNPFFIVVLTPLIIGFFAYLNRKGREPSAPRKIGFGMLIVAASFILLIIPSIGLPSPKILGGQVAPLQMLVSPYWLISTYLMQTFAELFLSPMGISFVSRVAPPKYKGLMQGGWFAATAIGNYLLGPIGSLWDRIPLWSLWLVLTICCLLSAVFIFSVMKRLERTTQIS